MNPNNDPNRQNSLLHRAFDKAVDLAATHGPKSMLPLVAAFGIGVMTPGTADAQSAAQKTQSLPVEVQKLKNIYDSTLASQLPPIYRNLGKVLSETVYRDLVKSGDAAGAVKIAEIGKLYSQTRDREIPAILTKPESVPQQIWDQYYTVPVNAVLANLNPRYEVALTEQKARYQAMNNAAGMLACDSAVKGRIVIPSPSLTQSNILPGSASNVAGSPSQSSPVATVVDEVGVAPVRSPDERLSSAMKKTLESSFLGSEFYHRRGTYEDAVYFHEKGGAATRKERWEVGSAKERSVSGKLLWRWAEGKELLTCDIVITGSGSAKGYRFLQDGSAQRIIIGDAIHHAVCTKRAKEDMVAAPQNDPKK